MDIAFGVLDYVGLGFIKLSLFFRVTILLAFFVVIIRQNDVEAWFVKGILLLWFLCMSVWVVIQGKLPIMAEVTFFLKTLYPMCIAFIVCNAMELAYRDGEIIEESIWSGIVVYGIIASLSIFFSLITGIGRNTYGEWGFGIKSFFTGGNDIGLTMLVTSVFAWVFFIRNNSVSAGVKVLLITCAIPLIGSRASWAGGAGVTACFTLIFLFLKEAKSLQTTILKLFIVSSILIVSFYAVKFVDENFDEIAFNVAQMTRLVEGVGPRDKLQDAGSIVLAQRPPLLDAFGQGFGFFYSIYDVYYFGQKLPSKEDSVSYKAAEQDLMDLYGVYGWLLGGAFLFYHAYYWFVAMRSYLMWRNIYYFGYFVSLSLFLFHGLLAGHALSTPQVGTLVGCIYGVLRFKARHSKISAVI